MEQVIANTPSRKLEDITSKSYLDQAFENAKKWCARNLPVKLNGLAEGFDYSAFQYNTNGFDEEMVSSGMSLSKDKEALIIVSPRKLNHLIMSEVLADNKKKNRYAHIGLEETEIRGSIQVDPESIFINKMTEHIVENDRFLKIRMLKLACSWKYDLSPEDAGYMMENLNRKERGLQLRPYIAPEPVEIPYIALDI